MMILLSLAFAVCVSVHGERLTAGDLAGVVPEFATVAPDTPLGYAPMPGASRTFSSRDIQKLATQAGISTSFTGALCFEWKMRKLERSELVDAMRVALNQPDARVEISEFSLYPAPEGAVVFPLAGLNRPLGGAAFWRGYIAYSGNRHFDIWAKVQLPGTGANDQNVDVRTGALVHVVVESGLSRLKFDGRAESSGLLGEKVTIRNPRSGRTFLAEITGKNSVRVSAGEEETK